MRIFKWIFILSLITIPGLLIHRVFYEFPDDWVKTDQKKLPIVYSDNYNITLFGLQRLHPFDSEKYGKIMFYLNGRAGISKERFYAPQKISDNDLRTVHSQKYLDSLQNPAVISQISEMGILRKAPNFIIQERLLDSIRYAVGGTVLGADLAMEEGWAINLAGGYHHAKAESGGGFGFFADVPIAIKKQWEINPKLKVLIIDLDAHQGNGNEEIFGSDNRVFILDVYGKDNYPRDEKAKQFIDFDRPVSSLSNDEYLDVVLEAVPLAIKNSQPDLIIYNAGSDILLGDPLGRMNLTKAGMIKRDEFVFDYAIKSKIPILMVLSGGYSSSSAQTISESIENILKKVLKKI